MFIAILKISAEIINRPSGIFISRQKAIKEGHELGLRQGLEQGPEQGREEQALKDARAYIRMSVKTITAQTK